jgi:hypothetical protein
MAKWFDFDKVKKSIGNGAKAVMAKLGSQDFAGEDEPVIFAGIEPPIAGVPMQGEILFGIYVKVEKDEAVWLPASASAPDVIEKLQAMKLGEQFRITAERGVGGIGTHVKAIEQDPKLPVIPIAENAPPFLKL